MFYSCVKPHEAKCEDEVTDEDKVHPLVKTHPIYPNSNKEL